MVRRISPAQARSKIRQAQQKQRQAVNNYNAAVRKYNIDVKRAVGNYNREVDAHNSKVRANRQRLRREVARLNASTSTRNFVVYQGSVSTLQKSFARVAASVEAGTWHGGQTLLDLTEGETANSIAVLNSLLAEPETTEALDIDGSLQETIITDQLSLISTDLDNRWHGALFSLSRGNPDAARHFCTSAREILESILVIAAPDIEVIKNNPSATKTPDGRVTRRARIRHCLSRNSVPDEDLEAFVEEDLENVLELFRVFNDGTHGSAGRFNLQQLEAIKRRVEDAILFLHHLVL